MVYQVFKNNYYILYVEGDKKSISENLIYDKNSWYPSSEKIYKYVGEYYSKDIIYKKFVGCFIDGFNNDSYVSFIKKKGLVNLMSNYWNNVIEKERILAINSTYQKNKTTN